MLVRHITVVAAAKLEGTVIPRLAPLLALQRLLVVRQRSLFQWVQLRRLLHLLELVLPDGQPARPAWGVTAAQVDGNVELLAVHRYLPRRRTYYKRVVRVRGLLIYGREGDFMPWVKAYYLYLF